MRLPFGCLFHFLCGGILSVTLLITMPAFGQGASTGAIRGTVVDALGRRIVGAPIALVNKATGFRYSARSDKEGVFQFQLLPAGDYYARASSSGSR